MLYIYTHVRITTTFVWQFRGYETHLLLWNYILGRLVHVKRMTHWIFKLCLYHLPCHTMFFYSFSSCHVNWFRNICRRMTSTDLATSIPYYNCVMHGDLITTGWLQLLKTWKRDNFEEERKQKNQEIEQLSEKMKQES